MNAAEKNPMLMMSMRVLDEKIRLAFTEGRYAGINSAIYAIRSISDCDIVSVDQVVAAIEATREVK